MAGYYARQLSGERLRRCYEIASPRVRRYLEAEIEHLLEAVGPRAQVLELGCGYGRVLRALAGKAGRVVGVDTSYESLRLARELMADERGFWEIRLDWFRAQATAGLLGAIDEAATGDGVIVCTDGFRAGTVSSEAFLSLVSGLGLAATVTEVDASSLFCDIRVR
jgi:SAM-dependent methyltransferase